MRQSPQQVAVIHYCEQNTFITQKIANDKHYTSRLAAVVKSMEKQGYRFEHKYVWVVNQYGVKVRIAEYYLDMESVKEVAAARKAKAEAVAKAKAEKEAKIKAEKEAAKAAKKAAKEKANRVHPKNR